MCITLLGYWTQFCVCAHAYACMCVVCTHSHMCVGFSTWTSNSQTPPRCSRIQLNSILTLSIPEIESDSTSKGLSPKDHPLPQTPILSPATCASAAAAAAKSLQSCPTLRDPRDSSPPGSPVHGIFQARVLEWGAIAFSDLSFWLTGYTSDIPMTPVLMFE